MAVSSSPWNAATQHRLETRASLRHPLSPPKELSLLPPFLSLIICSQQEASCSCSTSSPSPLGSLCPGGGDGE